MSEQTECNRCLQEHPPTVDKISNGKTIELSWYDERGICRKCGPEAMECSNCGIRTWGVKWQTDLLFKDRLVCPACFHTWGGEKQGGHWRELNDLNMLVEGLRNDLNQNANTLKLQLDRMEKHLSAIDYAFAIRSYELKRHFGIEDMD